MRMRQPRLEHHPIRMWTSVLLALGYGWLVLTVGSLTGSNTVDGIIGVLLGFYICSHPVARTLDLLYLPRVVRQDYLANEAGMMWLWLSILVVVIGVGTVIIGANRFVQPTIEAPLV